MPILENQPKNNKEEKGGGNPQIPEEKNSIIKEAFIFLWEICKVVVFSLAIILPVRYFLIQPFYVKGASMEPNFYDHEYLVVDQLSYRLRVPKRGEVVVFRYPRDPSQFFIKRIIGLPGETIRIRDGKIIIINKDHPDGEGLVEPYLSLNVKIEGNILEKLDDDGYYLMGDNRLESMDSRIFGPVKRKNIVGRVFFRGWPLDRIMLFNGAPAYGL